MPAIASLEAEAPDLAAPSETTENTHTETTPDYSDVAAALRDYDAGRAAPEEEPTPTPEPSETETPSGAAPAEEGTPAAEGDGDDDGEPAATPGKKDPRLRINPKNFDDEQGQRDYAAIDLVARSRREGNPISLVDAYRKLFGDAPTAAQAAPTAETPAETPKAEEPTVESIDARLKAIEDERKQAEAEFDLAKVNALNDEKLDLRDQRRDLANRQKSEQQTQEQEKEAATAKYQEENAASYKAVLEAYPEAADETSAFYQALNAEATKRAQRNPAFFADPGWPELIAPYVAQQTGIAPAAKAKPAPAAAAPGKQPATARPAAPSVNTPARPAVARPVSKPSAAAPAPRNSVPATTLATAPEKPVSFDEVRAALAEADRLKATKSRG